MDFTRSRTSRSPPLLPRADGRLEQPTADVPVFQRSHGGLVAGLDQRQQELAVVAGRAGRLGGAGDLVRRQSGQFPGVVQQQGRGLHAFLDPLPELRAKPGELGVQGLEPLLARRRPAGCPDWRNSLRYSSTSRVGFGIQAGGVNGGEPLVKRRG